MLSIAVSLKPKTINLGPFMRIVDFQNTPFDIVMMYDTTGSNYLNAINNYYVETRYVAGIYPQSRIGLASQGDLPSDSDPQAKPFEANTVFTSANDVINQWIISMPPLTPFGGGDEPEAQHDAIIQAANHNWQWRNNVVRILYLQTDAVAHNRGATLAEAIQTCREKFIYLIINGPIYIENIYGINTYNLQADLQDFVKNAFQNAIDNKWFGFNQEEENDN